MTSIRKRLLLAELVAAGKMPLDEARRGGRRLFDQLTPEGKDALKDPRRKK
jgi:hypothetical protein